MSNVWHPHAKRIPTESAGPMGPGGPKFVVHTTEGMDFDTMVRVLMQERAEPNFVLGLENGHRRLVQFIPVDHASRALEHPPGTGPTNTANAIQVEVCQLAANAQKWDPKLYRYLHLLMLWCHRHHGVPMEAHHPFYGQPGYHRLSPNGWIKASGLVGHCHAPNQTKGHWDPGNLNVEKVLR